MFPATRRVHITALSILTAKAEHGGTVDQNISRFVLFDCLGNKNVVFSYRFAFYSAMEFA